MIDIFEEFIKQFDIYMDGTIYRKSHETFNGKGVVKHSRKLRNGWVTSKGYNSTCFSINKKSYTASIHRMIAIKYIDNPNNYKQINHKNGIKTDNRVENLEWCNNSMNQIHAWETGLQKMDNKTGKKVLMIKDGEILNTFESMTQAARFVGLKRETTISLCANGKRKTAGGYVWKTI